MLGVTSTSAPPSRIRIFQKPSACAEGQASIIRIIGLGALASYLVYYITSVPIGFIAYIGCSMIFIGA